MTMVSIGRSKKTKEWHIASLDMMEKRTTSPLKTLKTTTMPMTYLEEIYGDMCCSDADYEDRPYYEILEEKAWSNIMEFFLWQESTW